MKVNVFTNAAFQEIDELFGGASKNGHSFSSHPEKARTGQVALKIGGGSVL